MWEFFYMKYLNSLAHATWAFKYHVVFLKNTIGMYFTEKKVRGWCSRVDSNHRQTRLRRAVLYPAELREHIKFYVLILAPNVIKCNILQEM